MHAAAKFSDADHITKIESRTHLSMLHLHQDCRIHIHSTEGRALPLL